MRLLNRFFTPFAAFLIASAMWFSQPEPWVVWVCAGILAADVLVNWWILRNSYRFIRWTQWLRQAQIWLNLVWAVPLVWLLGGTWAPMWLIFILAPVTAAMYASFTETLIVSIVSGGSLLGIYWLRGLEGEYAWGMAFVHAVFMPVLALFVHSLAQSALRTPSRP